MRIKVYGYIPSGEGYEPIESLADDQREEFSRRLVERLGGVLGPHVKEKEE